MTFSPISRQESWQRPLPRGIRLRRGSSFPSIEEEQATFEVMHRAMGYTSNWAHHYPTRSHLRASPNSSYWIAEEHHRFKHPRAVGYAHAIVREGVWSLTEFFVLPSHHRQGIGQALLDACLRDGGEAHADTHLVLASHNTSADALYMRRAGCFPRVPMCLLSGPVAQLQLLPPGNDVHIQDEQSLPSHTSESNQSFDSSQYNSNQYNSNQSDPNRFNTDRPYPNSTAINRSDTRPARPASNVLDTLADMMGQLFGKGSDPPRPDEPTRFIAPTPPIPPKISSTISSNIDSKRDSKRDSTIDPTTPSDLANPLSESAIPVHLIASPIVLTPEIEVEMATLDRDIVGFARPEEHRFWSRSMEVSRLFRDRTDGRLVGYAYFGSHSSGPALALDPALLPPMLAHTTRLLPRQIPLPDADAGITLPIDNDSTSASQSFDLSDGFTTVPPDAYWAVAGTNEVMLNWLLNCGWKIVFQYLFMSSRPLGRMDRYVCHNPLYLL